MKIYLNSNYRTTEVQANPSGTTAQRYVFCIEQATPCLNNTAEGRKLATFRFLKNMRKSEDTAAIVTGMGLKLVLMPYETDEEFKKMISEFRINERSSAVISRKPPVQYAVTIINTAATTSSAQTTDAPVAKAPMAKIPASVLLSVIFKQNVKPTDTAQDANSNMQPQF
ncbi:hypothetical protein Lste_0656 [Legionella steelei]|uniref:Uncharacterized protein n=1 Tax=Legionella steelei TaxID=947033 RepID=A0A0W0ZLW5_9GAMM|nr:hypothetical protein [Legionella steelei]KTD70052.1 hypothetical protein Lste_0656 [Legionella steelei]